jgi:hypothetical protein
MFQAAEVRFEISNGGNKKNTHIAPGALKGILLYSFYEMIKLIFQRAIARWLNFLAE